MLHVIVLLIAMVRYKSTCINAVVHTYDKRVSFSVAELATITRACHFPPISNWITVFEWISGILSITL